MRAVVVRPTKRTGRCLPGQHTGCSEREETQMKQLTNYQRVSQYLVKVFKAINESYFSNELEIPTITIQSNAGSYGHVSVQKVWHNQERQTRELNISADYLDRPIENVVATLIHEASHLWALQNHIQDTSNRGVYHNKKFKAIAEGMGHLKVERHPKYGWTVTFPTEDTLDFVIENGFQDIQLVRQPEWQWNGKAQGEPDGASAKSPVRKPSSTRKYICPCCGNSFRATKDIRVLCLDCNVPFEKEER